MRSLSLALGLVGGFVQLAIAFLGDAVGGLSGIVILLGVDALVAVIGGALIFKWSRTGLVLLTVAAISALVLLFWSTWLEVAVASLLLGAGVATFISIRRVRLAS